MWIGHTVYQFIYQYKVVLHSLLVNLPKIRLRNIDELVAILKYKCRISVAPESVSALVG